MSWGLNYLSFLGRDFTGLAVVGELGGSPLVEPADKDGPEHCAVPRLGDGEESHVEPLLKLPAASWLHLGPTTEKKLVSFCGCLVAFHHLYMAPEDSRFIVG